MKEMVMKKMTGGGTFADAGAVVDVVSQWRMATESQCATVATAGNARVAVGRATPEAREAGNWQRTCQRQRTKKSL